MKKKTIGFILAGCLIATISAMLCACGSDENIKTGYDIKAVVDYENKAVTAEMAVSYYNASDSSLGEVCFHLYPAAFREGARFSPVEPDRMADAYVNGISYGGIDITALSVGGIEQTPVIEGEDDDILSVDVGELLPGERAEIKLGFALSLPDVRHRFGHHDGIINLGNWYPIACVYENGGFVTDPYYAVGDPFFSDCADYKVTLTVPEELTVVGTGERVRTGNVCSFTARSVRDFALVIGKFKAETTVVDGVTVSYYYAAGSDGAASVKAASDAIKTFSAMFGEYPYKNYSVVKAPFLHGGMEYPCLAIVSDALSGEALTEAIIHETAHQWWYGAVGNNEVASPWLDEGLTEYSTSLFYRENADYGVSYEKRMADALGSYVLYYDTFKNSGADTSMNRRVSEYASTFEYTFMTYVKGELLFEALRNALGDEKFFGGLRDYYSEYKYKNATSDELIGCMEKRAGVPLKSFFDSFTEGKTQHFGGLK